ncbi:hypothetical protein NQ315_010833 [Exocentrus adspersus]|uniref:Uncharacterized protein n=1 Tax=Exocentrus adspersus TaxID=1586481 RepID=A0AAV8V7N9_9CUCU|nr:hypothetical protein NQ315_010833 [Exocentrus adspersus]
MADYSFQELADIHLIYGESRGILITRVFGRTHSKLREHESFKHQPGVGAPPTIHTVAFEEAVLDAVIFCLGFGWWIQQNELQPDFGQHVHISDYDNPHAIALRRDQHQFAINIWAGIVDDCIIGLYLLPPRLTGPIYRDFVANVLPGPLEDVPLNVHYRMWFQHNEAPAHFALAVREHLDYVFPNSWLGCRGAVRWPARSPDLTPMDFFFSGVMLRLVYEEPIHYQEELLARVMAACT